MRDDSFWSYRAAWRFRLCRWMLVLIGGVWPPSFWGRPSTAEERPSFSFARLAEVLSAGEFGVALEMAGELAEGERRDDVLASIAAAQSRVGAQRAASETALAISADETRYLTMIEPAADRRLGTGRGGGTQADFNSLIELIMATVEPDSWEDVGGTGTIAGFPNGVYVDPRGVLHRLVLAEDARGRTELDPLAAPPRFGGGPGHVDRPTALRLVSLTRLEKALLARRAADQPPTREMETLAGLYRIKYLLVYPDAGEVMLAGPAGPCVPDNMGRLVNSSSGEPVLRLDDLVVILSNGVSGPGRFLCSITPREANLAATQQFLRESAAHPVRATRRKQWVDQLRAHLGRQRIEVSGIDPGTHAAQVIVEADYHMKLIGMGLEPGTWKVASYLDRIEIGPDATPPPLDVLRWWFTLRPEAVRVNPGRTVYELPRQSVQVLSENEMLTAQGQRVGTGRADPLNSAFAADFTRDFDQLARQYPIYAQLRNLFDLAVLAAILREDDVVGRSGWQPTLLIRDDSFLVGRVNAPQEVESVINYRVLNRRYFVAGVSGGVEFNAANVSVRRSDVSSAYRLKDVETSAAPADRSNSPYEQASRWWWDVED